MSDIREQTAGEIMQKGVVIAKPDQALVEVERILVENHVTGLPVVEQGRLVGIVSRSDIARARVLTEALDSQVTDEMNWDETQADGFKHVVPPAFHGFGQRLEQMKAKDVMRTQVVTCTAAAKVKEVATQMVRNHIHRVVVVEGERLVGIVSSLDLVGLIAGVKPTVKR